MLITEGQLFTGQAELPVGIFSPRGVAYLRQRQSQLHTHMTLTHDQWLEVDGLLVTVADNYLGAVLDLTQRGLVQPISSLGVSASMYHGAGTMGPANRSMYASAAGQDQRLAVVPHTILLPFSFEDYSFDITELEASQRGGQRLDLTHAEEAQRKVAEDEETLLFQGSTTFTPPGGEPIYGYLTHPGRATGAAPGPWSDPDNIFPTLQAMYGAMVERKRAMGPFGFYCAAQQWSQMHAERGVDVAWNVMRKLQASFPMIQSWRPIFCLPAGEAVLVEFQRRTVDVAIRLDMTNIPWEMMGGLKQHVRVMASITPRIKVTQDDGLTGIVHYTGADTPP